MPVHMEWLLNDEDVITALPFTTVASIGSHTSLLMINNVTAHHAGQYVCRANNKVGSFQRTKRLKINGKKKFSLYKILKIFFFQFFFY